MSGRPTRLLRRVERAVLAAAMGAIAFAIERRVLRAIRKRGEAPPQDRATLADGTVSELGHRS